MATSKSTSADKAEGVTVSTDAHAAPPTASTADTGDEKLNTPVPSMGPDTPEYHEQYQATQQQLAKAQRPDETAEDQGEPVQAYSEEGSFHG